MLNYNFFGYYGLIVLSVADCWCKCMQLEVFRKTLMQSLKEDDDNSVSYYYNYCNLMLPSMITMKYFVAYHFSLGLMKRVF